jgi:predicted nucleotidyltransferase
MVALSEQTLQGITQRLVEALRPERIYLFGSQARRVAGPGSDLDLLLVVRDGAERRVDVARAARRLMRDLPCSVDLVVRYAAQFDDRAEWPTTPEATAKSRGLRLHG